MSICRIRLFSLLSFTVALLALAGSAGAGERWPSSELLLPCHEVLIEGLQSSEVSLTTYLDVVNSGAVPLDVRITVFSNWGIEVFRTEIRLEPNELRPIDLAKWFVDGQLPDRQLDPEEIEHVQTALCGEVSPLDDHFYSTEVDAVPPRRAVGSVVIEALGDHPDALWGDFFIVDSSGTFAQGEVLANLDPEVESEADDDDLCGVHAFRFMEGGAFDGGTEFMVWNATAGEPSETADYAGEKIPVLLTDYAQSGEVMAQIALELEPLQMYSVADFALPNHFGWIKLDSRTAETFVAVRYSANDRFSAMMETFCLKRREGPCLTIEKAVNGLDADHLPGPPIPMGMDVEWTYEVTNECDEPLYEVVVTDSDPRVDPICDGNTLEPGESLLCRAEGVALCGRHANLGTVTALTLTGEQLEAWDRSHYVGVGCRPDIRIEKTTNGQDADHAPGPEIAYGSPVEWNYVVTNMGEVTLYDVSVTDDMGVEVTCPQTELAVRERMICVGRSTAECGDYRNVGTARGVSDEGEVVIREDPSHYVGAGRECDWPAIEIEKWTNGEDADETSGPAIAAGGEVLWTYHVLNAGDTPLSDVTVTDSDPGLDVSCPKTTLEPLESMVCTAEGVAICDHYRNLGRAVGTPPEGPPVSDEDPSHYNGVDCTPVIDLEKSTNGEDVESPADLEIPMGSALQWTYTVTNRGDVPLTEVAVTDDQGVTVVCPKSSLEPGETMDCIGHGVAVCGRYTNRGTASGMDPRGRTVNNDDPSHYTGIWCEPGIDVEKSTNGEDADEPDGPELTDGEAIEWTYTVTNTGDTPLENVTVVDNMGVEVACPKTSLEPGESMDCYGYGSAGDGNRCGPYANLGTATGQTPQGATVADEDPSHHLCVPVRTEIDLEKWTNGMDADEEPGPRIDAGSPVVWTYRVTNLGTVALHDVAVMDDQGVEVGCPKTTLEPGESMDCFGQGTAICDDYVNLGTTGGTSPAGVTVFDEDPSHYEGVNCEEGDEGCTPGYWKNHEDSWTGLSTDQTVSSLFTNASAYTAGSASLHDALNFGGGPDLEAKVRILLRAAVAAALNSLHPDVGYPWTYGEVVSKVDAALASGDADGILALATSLDQANNLGCPLN